MIQALQFLLEHAGLIDAIKDAIDAGTSKEDLLRVIRESQIAASDAAMKEEIG